MSSSAPAASFFKCLHYLAPDILHSPCFPKSWPFVLVSPARSPSFQSLMLCSLGPRPWTSSPLLSTRIPYLIPSSTIDFSDHMYVNNAHMRVLGHNPLFQTYTPNWRDNITNLVTTGHLNISILKTELFICIPKILYLSVNANCSVEKSRTHS